MKIVNAKWKGLTAEEKQPYEEQAAAERKRIKEAKEKDSKEPKEADAKSSESVCSYSHFRISFPQFYSF